MAVCISNYWRSRKYMCIENVLFLFVVTGVPIISNSGCLEICEDNLVYFLWRSFKIKDIPTVIEGGHELELWRFIDI